MKDVWNPQQYEKFRNERQQPFLDLLAMVRPQADMRIADLGCGTGEPAQILHRHLHARETIGFDNSDAMLKRAESFAGDGLRFEKCNIEDFAATTAYGTFDLIFSNAALHWVSNHQDLFAGLASKLNDGGQVAVQVPANTHHLSHTVAAEIANESPFVEAMSGYERDNPVLKPEEYATIFHKLGFTEQSVRLQVYCHLLESKEEVIEWVKGTRLTDYQKRMPEELYPQFLARYREVLLPRLEDMRPFLYTYNRILMWARK